MREEEGKKKSMSINTHCQKWQGARQCVGGTKCKRGQGGREESLVNKASLQVRCLFRRFLPTQTQKEE